MARCYCRWRNVLVCVCTPCICLALLLVYVVTMVCMEMNSSATQRTMDTVHRLEKSHFVAWGTYKKENFAPLPEHFWKHNPDKNAFWNKLQLAIDNNFNPILHPNKTKRRSENSSFKDSLLKQSFTEVINSDNTRKDMEKLPEQMQEYVRFMQRRDYPVLLWPDAVCGAQAKDEKEPPLLLLAIKTTELNFKNRQAIRQTWGQVGWVAGQKRNNSRDEVGGYVRRVFLLGKDNLEELGVDISNLLKMENKRHGDILQWDFQDTFFNLTLKDVLFWSWFSRFCGQARFVFKGDDDIFLNTPKMITYLQDQLKKSQAHKTMGDFMVGEVIGSAIPNRVNNSKYFIPESFYNGLYPMYAGGGGVVYSGLLAKRLHHVSKSVHLFPIDDVYVGMCMIRLNALPVHHPAFLTFDFPKKEGKELCSYHTILLVHKRNPSQLIKLWADMKKTQAQCRDVPLRTEDKEKDSQKQ